MNPVGPRPNFCFLFEFRNGNNAIAVVFTFSLLGRVFGYYWIS